MWTRGQREGTYWGFSMIFWSQKLAALFLYLTPIPRWFREKCNRWEAEIKGRSQTLARLEITLYWAREGNVPGGWAWIVPAGRFLRWSPSSGRSQSARSSPHRKFPTGRVWAKGWWWEVGEEWDNELWSNKRLRGWERERAREVASPTSPPWNSQMFSFL